VVLLLAALTATVATAAPAYAHNVLRSSAPADGASLPAPPADVALVFDRSVASLGTDVAVSGPAGPLTLEPVVVDGATVTQPLPAELPAGAYEIQWRATSADGHPLSGEIGFVAESGANPSSTGAATPVTSVSGGGGSDLSTAARVALAAGALAALAGGVVALLSKGRRSTTQD
jgi:methionine-rich copper-binding protein CopC